MLLIWDPYIFWILNLCQMQNFQIFSSFLKVVSSFQWFFTLLCRSFLVSCNFIYQFMLWRFYSKYSYPVQCHEAFSLLCSSIFMILSSTFKSLIYAELIFIYGERSDFFLLHVNIQVSRYHLFKMCPFLVYVPNNFVESQLIDVWIYFWLSILLH